MSDYGEQIAAGVIRLERMLPGPIERVWAYLTEPDKRATWLAGGTMELRPGGRVELLFNHSELTPHEEHPPDKYRQFSECSRVEGNVLRCEPPALLSYTWGEAADGASEVTFELTSAGEGVRLVITHRRLHTRDLMINVASGWHAHVDILIERLHGREPGPFWAAHTRLEAEYARRIAVE